jgi:hypothetical protein
MEPQVYILPGTITGFASRLALAEVGKKGKGTSPNSQSLMFMSSASTQILVLVL